MTLLGGYIVLFRMRGCYALLPSIALVTMSPIHKFVIQLEWMGYTAILNIGWKGKLPHESMFPMFNQEDLVRETFDDIQTGSNS